MFGYYCFTLGSLTGLARGIRAFTLLIVYSSLTLLPAHAGEDDLNFVTLRHPPYGFLSSSGEKQGYLFEIANQIMKVAGFNGKNEIIPTLRVFSELESGSAHCSILARVPVPEARYDKLAPIGKEIEIAVIPKRSVEINGYKDLKRVKIGVPRGLFVGEPFDSDKELIKVPTKGYELSSIMFKHGRVEAVVGAYDSMLLNMEKVGVGSSDLGKALTLSSFPIWVMCQPGKISSDQRERLISATRKLRENGTISRIIQKYLNSDIFS